MPKRIVYADAAATTRISDTVFAAIEPYLKEQYGNASGIYSLGRNSKKALENARESAAQSVGCMPKELFFTSGGTESDNWAISGVYNVLSRSGKNHIITSMTEHHAVLNTCSMIEKSGGKVTYLRPDSNGTIDPESIKKAITENTALVSVMYVNNETGMIQPVNEISKICREASVLFHCDAVQAAGHIKLDMSAGISDLMSFSGHKIHALKGSGALYIKKGTPISNLMFGGQQERSLRPGTENTAAAVALGRAFEETACSLSEKNTKLQALQKKLTDGLSEIKGIHFNSDPELCVPGICSITFKGADSETLVLMLDRKGICVSGGSACTTGSSAPSHVLLAMGLSASDANSTIRFSFDEYNTEDDIDYILTVLPEILYKIRK